MTVKLLDTNTINKIAAGEVVERQRDVASNGSVPQRFHKMKR